MAARILFLLASLLVLTACSTPLTKEAGPAPGGAQPAAAPRAESTQAPATVSPPAVAPNPLKDPRNILSQRSVFFDYDQAFIKDADRPVLEAHARYLREHPSARVTVQGNCDERGSREYNLALGQRRADAVKRFMTLLGASEREIETVSFGKEKPRCTLSEESCWSQNRRADLVYAGD